MRSLKIILGLFIFIILIASATHAQKQFTHTVTAKNKYCNSTCSIMDVPELNDNPVAVILVRPLEENVTNRNPHPVGVFYVPFSKKWSIINTDGTAIAEGAKFDVQYYPKPDSNQFVYVIPQLGAVACIDHASLNGNPSAQIRFSPTGSSRGAYFNAEEVRIEYQSSASKWCLANVNNTRIRPDTAFNIVVSSGAAAGQTQPLVTSAPYVPVLPSTVLATPAAPLVVVAREEWLVPPQGNVALSPGYCKVVWGSYDNPGILATDSVIITHQVSPGDGEWLRWAGNIKNGSIVLTVCNTKMASLGATGAMHFGGRKLNILVLR